MRTPREGLRLDVARRLRRADGLARLAQLFVERGPPPFRGSANGPACTAPAVRDWLHRVGGTTRFIEPGRPWANGDGESFNGTRRAACRNRERFATLLEAPILIEGWRREDNPIRPHRALGYRPPAPETQQPRERPLTRVPAIGLTERLVQRSGPGQWLHEFIRHTCSFRSVVIDWSIWDGSYFGDPFQPDALKKRKAYKKWAEILLHPELNDPLDGRSIRGAELYLDRLRIAYGYDVIDHLRERFTENLRGASPYISKFQHTDSWRDANQCLQLCDLLTGGIYQTLKPAESATKQAARRYLEHVLRPVGVTRLDAGFWRGYDPSTLRNTFRSSAHGSGSLRDKPTSGAAEPEERGGG